MLRYRGQCEVWPSDGLHDHDAVVGRHQIPPANGGRRRAWPKRSSRAPITSSMLIPIPSFYGFRWGWRQRPLLLAEAGGHDDVQEGIQGRRREYWVGGGGGDNGGNGSNGHHV
ncbi:hypothetical protein SAY86_001812 [Trapa natans]|uniref:Uncharacterized protein n=1 Tax=Trapa natans TaxID=22666 RepID=A0AAN7LMX6_TRANT|nr:hypothetical protein SAY86_001812 [Trapa natans]